MLKQLADLSVSADGRFATANELQFLKDYLATAEQRLSAYETIRDSEAVIVDETREQALEVDPEVFNMGGFDATELCIRDQKIILRWLAATMLMGDLDRLRDGLLLWQKTIMKGVKQEHTSEIMSQVFPKAIARQLPPEIVTLLQPSLTLQQTILG